LTPPVTQDPPGAGGLAHVVAHDHHGHVYVDAAAAQLVLQNLTGRTRGELLAPRGDVHARRVRHALFREFLERPRVRGCGTSWRPPPGQLGRFDEQFRPAVGLGGLLGGAATTRLHSRMTDMAKILRVWGAVTFLLPRPLAGEGSG